MHALLRLIRLLGLARLRSAGWAPWLIFAGWLIGAAYQEPQLLRRYGIYLLDDAAWTGGLVVLVILLMAESRLPRRGAAAINLLMLACMAVVQAIGAYVVDQGAWSASLADRSLYAACFVLSWAPLSLALARKLPPQNSARVIGVIVVLATFLLGCMLAVELRSSPDTLVFLAAALATLGAASWSMPSRDRT